MQIHQIQARVCFNGRGDPGIEADVWVDGKRGRALSPSGASRGSYEAVPFVDKNDPEKTARLVKTYSDKLIGIDAADQRGITAILKQIDGTSNYSKIGGSAAYAISVAAAQAEAAARNVPLYQILSSSSASSSSSSLDQQQAAALPYPLGNVVGGGKHASDLSPSIQEILVCPLGATTITEAIQLNIQVSKRVGQKLSKLSSYPVGRGDEGGWSPGIGDERAIQLVNEAVSEIQDGTDREIRVGLDFASGSLYDPASSTYYYRASKKRLDREGQLAYVAELADRFELFYLEDPLHEEDFEGFASLRASLDGVLVVGDDLYTTNKERLVRGVALKSTNGVIVKVNQVGTLGEAWEFSTAARAAGNTLAASHRSGDNEGGELAHIAVGFRCGLIKCGIIGGERTAKLNELIRISEAGAGFQRVRL